MRILPIFESMGQDENQLKFQIQAELDSIINKYEAMGMRCWIYLKSNIAIHIASIKIPNMADRKQGLGSALMSEITELCDKYNLLCVLTPADTETPLRVLLRFYSKFGFVSNKGRHKDFRFMDSMIRYPK